MSKYRSREFWEWVRSIVIAIVLALVIRFFLFEVFVVEGGSMSPTLEENERLVVNKIVYRLDEPRYGEIVVFEFEPGRDFIKRVIGMGGDTIEIRAGKLYRNGKKVEEPYLIDELQMRDYGPVTVPEGKFFLMGDYRTNSMDSRDGRVGFIPEEKIKGRAFFIFWPPWEARLLERKVEIW